MSELLLTRQFMTNSLNSFRVKAGFDGKTNCAAKRLGGFDLAGIQPDF